MKHHSEWFTPKRKDPKETFEKQIKSYVKENTPVTNVLSFKIRI